MSGQQELNVRGKGKGIPEDKVVLVGSQGVGKTTIFKRFTTGRFVEEEDLSHHSLSECRMQWDVRERGRASLTLYDTAGVERYTRTIQPSYYHHARAVMLVYSINNEDSFDAIGDNWIDNASNYADTTTAVVLVGNKLDLVTGSEAETEEGEDERKGGARAISRKRAAQFAQNQDIEEDMVFEISAKTGDGFQEMFDAVACKLGFVVALPSEESTQVENGDKPCSC